MWSLPGGVSWREVLEGDKGDKRSWIRTLLGVVNTQYGVQMIYYRIVHPNPI